ncbi:MAG TPA: bifunctional shikimate kinase/3-dehydroquinate synthase [Solirubrobacteraceae bacterium]
MAAVVRAASGQAPARDRAIVLIGFMGAGKSTVAVELAAALGGTPHDSDALLEERFGHPVAREFELRGEASFRATEEELVCGLLNGAGSGDVIALGGGSILSERVRGALGDHLAVLLDVDPAVAWERVRAQENGAERPLASDRDAFLALHAERSALYEELADVVLLWASSASGDYPVFVGRGLLGEERLGGIWPLDRSASRPFCVSDETVAALYGKRMGEVAATIAIPPGEGHKTLASAERVWTELVVAGMTRADHVVALGGGVVGDLAGFCAATYQRGVPVVQIPTTLVAQVDSAYGGKTGVDLPAAKNYVGTYHQPAGVLVDPDLLETLPAAELAAGWVEVLKTALIAGGELWERVAAGGAVDERTILACARTKLAVVAEDERDAGRRQVLNLGHTVGHAIETATGYGRYRHGEAVGLGLLAALRLSGREDLRARVRELLLAHELPVTLDGAGVEIEEIIAATARDKKRVAANVPFVLVKAPGEIEYGCEVDMKALRAAVAELTL